LFDFSLGYGPLAVGGAFQGGDLKGVSAFAGFWSGYNKISDVDWQCFEGDAPIETNKGTKLIPEIKADDVVKTWNENTKQFEWKKVLNIFARTVDQTLHVKLSNGQTMKVTPEHKILANGIWVLAKDLKVGSKLLGSNGKEVFVQSVQITNKRIKVYNFETEDNHTYVAYGVVVHNKCIKDAQGNLYWKEESYQLSKGETLVTDKVVEATVALKEGAMRAFGYMPDETASKFAELFTPESLQAMAALAVTYAAAHAIGIGEAADLILTGMTAVVLGKDALIAGSGINNYAIGSIGAKTQEEMNKAAQALAESLAIATRDSALVGTVTSLNRLGQVGKVNTAIEDASKIANEVDLGASPVQQPLNTVQFKGNYLPSYSDKLANVSNVLNQETGFITSEHAANQLVGRLQQGRISSLNEVVNAIKSGTQYIETNGNTVYYGNNLSVHINSKNIIESVVPRKSPKTDWILK
jgi:hypothetical protein